MKSFFTVFSSGSLAINIVTIFALFFFTFGQLARISLPGQPVYFYLYEVFVYLALFILVLQFKLAPFKTNRYLLKPLGIFFGWLVISLIISCFFYTASQNVVASLYLIRLAAYFLFFIYFNSYIHGHTEVKKGFHIVILLMAFGVIASSLVQYFLYQNFGNISYLGWDPHQYRLVGLFFDPPLTVSVLVLFLLYYFLQTQGKSIVFNWGLAAVFCILTFLTYSRGGYLALLVTAIVYGFRKLKLLHAVFIITGLVLIVILLPKGTNESINLFRTTSIFTRTQDYAIALDIWKKSPFTGIGYNHIRYEKDTYSEEPLTEEFNPSHASASFHSSFLMILVTSGVVGLGLYGLLLYKLGLIHEFAKYSIIFLSVLSLTDNVFLHPFVLFLLFILIPLFPLIRPSATSR